MSKCQNCIHCEKDTKNLFILHCKFFGYFYGHDIEIISCVFYQNEGEKNENV